MGVATLALLIAVSAVIPAVTISAQTAPTASCYTYVRDLTVGSTGADVTALQTFLVARGHLVMPAGVSKGYFGALTRSSLAKYQAAKGIAPAVGYFGPLTRGRVALDCKVTPPNPDDNDDDLSGGEASLEQFQLSGGNDSNVEENEVAEIAEIEFDVEDGDVRINRVDLTFTANNSNEENDPWEAFDTVRLLVDGDEIAEADLSDEDDWLDEDEPYVFRLSNVDYIVREGESANIVVELTAQGNVDGADNDLAEWTIYVEDNGIRAEDAEGIQQYVGDEDETVTFDIDVEGEGDELNVRSSSENPNSTPLRVENDNKSDMYTIFAFELESEEADVEIDSIQIDLTSSVAVSNLISDLVLEIDGEEFDNWSFVGTGTSTRTVQFDIDGDYVLDADSEVSVALKAEFKAANGSNYNSGATIRASINDGDVEGEGADDIVSEGSANGDTHTLATQGVTVSTDGRESDTIGVNDTIGKYTFTVNLESFEDDSYVKLTAERGTTENNNGFNVVILDENNNVVTTGVTSFTVSASEDEDSNGFVEVSEGDSVEFEVTVFFDAATAGSYKAQLYSANFNDTAANADQQYLLVPVSSYRTSGEYIAQ